MLSLLFSSQQVLITDFQDLFDIQYSREIDLKINWSLKTPLYGHKGLLSPADGLLSLPILKLCFRLIQ